jgi:hypothetical protein
MTYAGITFIFSELYILSICKYLTPDLQHLFTRCFTVWGKETWEVGWGKNPPPKFYNYKFYLVLMNQKSQYKITLYIVSIGWAQIAGLCLCLFNFNCVSWVAQSVQCLATGWTTGQLRFDPRHRWNNSSCSLCVQNSSGVHNGYRGSFPRV